MTSMKNGGVWPTMITPFTDENKIDYKALEKAIDWYIDNGVSGLFAVCQSSEMFYLDLKERTELAHFVKEKSRGRVPVVASGHISDDIESQKDELCRMADTGVDALILITNRLAKANESDDIWIENLKRLLEVLPKDKPLGFYECPYPYKRLMTPKTIDFCVSTGRFRFLKDTSCDIENIKLKLGHIKGSCFKLYNANTATLTESLRLGAYGYSGVMANFQPDLYAWLLKNYNNQPEKTEHVQGILTMCALIERQLYPINAKYYMQLNGLDYKLNARNSNKNDMTETFKLEVRQLIELSDKLRECIGLK